MLRRYPATIRWRQALPPLFVLSLLGLVLLSPWWELARLGLAVEAALYSLVLFLAGVQAAVRQKKPTLAIGLPLGIATMHISWGSGFIWSLMSSLVKI
jgi:succinoglycan biosynthesis protein ExoA